MREEEKKRVWWCIASLCVCGLVEGRGKEGKVENGETESEGNG